MHLARNLPSIRVVVGLFFQDLTILENRILVAQEVMTGMMAFHNAQKSNQLKKQFEKSIKEEANLNQQREKYGRGRLTAICKGELKLFAENSHLRDKFHHAPDLDSPIPPTLGIQELNRLSNSNLYKERLKVFRNREILPETYVEQFGRDLRFAVLSPDTIIKKGTLRFKEKKIISNYFQF